MQTTLQVEYAQSPNNNLLLYNKYFPGSSKWYIISLMVRTRIAPSPTGYPHIGTIYQALFDYAYAKRFNGQFIIRIEDTDRSRFVEDAEQVIFKAFDWFNLIEDESPRKPGKYAPYRQSERLELYKKYALELIEKKHAYYCFCTKERLDEVRKNLQASGKISMYDKHCRNLTKQDVVKRLNEGIAYVIRMKIPENTTITVEDGIRGKIEFDSNGIDDQVLIKADGFPTYHLAVVVDDHSMRITHMLRGEEWISSAPKHFLLYDYFNWEKPLFFHTALLRNPDKSKLSKRHGHTSVKWYQENGYLPEAILNYLGLMGWTHPDGKEIFSLEEFVSVFDMKNLRAIGPIFDLKKLDWLNGEYIRIMSNQVLLKRILGFIGEEYDKEIVKKTIPLIKERIKTLAEFIPMCEFFFKAPEQYELDLSSKKDILATTCTALSSLESWQAKKIGEVMLQVAKENNMKNSEYFMIMRVAITGKKISPPLNESMEILGKQDVLKRLQKLM